MTQNPLTMGVLGPSGMGGSHICVELLRRGHRVIGISRAPQKIGVHEHYESRPVDLEADDIDDIAKVFNGLDVVVCAYGPHSTGKGAMKYMPFLESVRKIVAAAKQASVGYFLMIGGCGSLYLPGTSINAVDSPEWWIAFWRGVADSPAHISYMEKRFGGGGPRPELRAYRSARIALREARDTPEAQYVRDTHEEGVIKNDHGKPFITACRTSIMFFKGNASFRWTFCSPPALYRSGRSTGHYETWLDYVPVSGDQKSSKSLEGRLRGITTGDFAIAVADEAERRQFTGKHWTCWAELDHEEDPPSPYIDLRHV